MLSFDQFDRQPVLSEREHQILELVAAGFSAKEVAQKIFIAPRTVERHIENIRLKMRARNRTHMVTCAAMAGMLVLGRDALLTHANESREMPNLRRFAS